MTPALEIVPADSPGFEESSETDGAFHSVEFDHAINFECSADSLISYAFSRWEPVIFDALAIAAAIELADKSVRRPAGGWARNIVLTVPVLDPARWNEPELYDALLDAVVFLTGDNWDIVFKQWAGRSPTLVQANLDLEAPTKAVLAYSDGMDSRAVAGLMHQEFGDALLRVRVGKKNWDHPKARQKVEPFRTVPYRVNTNIQNNRESGGRHRGFKFAMISGIAAYLCKAERIIIPESGQGAFGPALVRVAHAYPDYRNHPLFTSRMERFFRALFGEDIRFSFPRLWHTKGETLKAYSELPGSSDWESTKSCWRGNQWSSVGSKHRQCGVCAACMLRRLSVHAAGLQENVDNYICTDLSASSLEDAVHKDFSHGGGAYREYAIAGTLHLDHLADMSGKHSRSIVKRHASLIGQALSISTPEAQEKLQKMLDTHAWEWARFVQSHDRNSFFRQWTRYGNE